MTPRWSSAYGDTTTRCLLAVMAGANSVRDVQHATGVPSTATVWSHLRVLRRAGLVTWEPRKQRTLRAAVLSTPPSTMRADQQGAKP